MELIKKIKEKFTAEKKQPKPDRSPKIDRFFKVHNWMFQMGMSGYEVLVFAFIYSYSRQQKGYCYRSEVLGGLLNITADTADKIISNLSEKKRIYRDKKGMLWTNKK